MGFSFFDRWEVGLPNMEIFWLLQRWGVHLIWCRMHNLQEHCICSAPLCTAGGCQTTHVVRLMIDKDFRGTYTNLVGRVFFSLFQKIQKFTFSWLNKEYDYCCSFSGNLMRWKLESTSQFISCKAGSLI